MRASIVLACSAGASNDTAAAKLGVTAHTVSKWRRRFIEQRIDGLEDKPRSGAPRVIEDAVTDAVIARTLDKVPANLLNWTTRTLAQELRLSPSAVHRIWRRFRLKPHLQALTGRISESYAGKRLCDIVGVSIESRLSVLALCVADLPPIGVAVSAKRKSRREKPKRFPLNSLHAVVGSAPPATSAQGGRSGKSLLRFLQALEQRVPTTQEIHLMVELRHTHLAQDVQSWLMRHHRFRQVRSANLASWLYQLQCSQQELADAGEWLEGHAPTREFEGTLDKAIARDRNWQPLTWLKAEADIHATHIRIAIGNYETSTLNAK